MASIPSYLPEMLTREQREAVLHYGLPLLIIAGPGSGKTEVISSRAAHFIQAGYAQPENLLVTTFTNKAALELKDRIQRKLPNINVELMQVSTIHSFCAALLRQYEDASPIGGAFDVLDEAGQLLFVFAHRKDLGLSELVKGREHDFYNDVVGTFNLATEEMVAPADLARFCAKQCACAGEHETGLWAEEGVVAEAYAAYCDLLKEHRLADFAWLQRYTYNMLSQHPKVLAEVQSQFTHVLVDEYQDTNALQDRIIGLIATGGGKQLTVVGDDDQALYRFRGATVKNILDFTNADKYPGAHTVHLTQNFRSREQIVDHSLRVIVNNPARFDKDLFTTRGRGADILLLYEHSAGDEAQAAADLLRRLYDIGTIQRWSDVAILLRSVRSYAEPYLSALNKAGVPVVVTGEGTFFDREEIEGMWQLISFLGASKPWGDRFVRHPIMNLSPQTVDALAAIKDDLTGFETAEQLEAAGIADHADRGRLLRLIGLKRRVRAGQYGSLLEVFHELLAVTGVFARCERRGQGEPLRNLGILSQLVANFDTYGQTRNFYQFMAYLKLLREGRLDPIVEPPEDAVQVMTIHQAKGLEFPVVVIGAAMEGRLPTRYRSARYEIPYHLRASGEPEVDDPHLIDERRLFYVAATRARDLLVIGTADVVNKRGSGPSRFLREMFGDDLHAVGGTSAAYIEEQIGSREAGSGEPRRRHSYSQIAYYLQCPLRYKYAEVYNLQSPAPEPHNFGANVHRALRALHERVLAGQPVGPDDIPSLVEAAWLPSPQGTTEEEESLKQKAVKQIQGYVERHAADMARVEAAECSFAFSLDEHVLAGRIDLVRRDEDGVEIVDFKTGRSTFIADDQIETQLELYALGARADLGLDVRRQTVHFLGDNRAQSWGWSAQAEQAARAGLDDILDHIVAGDFVPRTAYCARCDEFRALCPYAADT